MKNIIYVIITILLLFNFVQANEFKIFVGANGKEIVAKFISFDQDSEIVKIELRNKKILNVKLPLFSETDQKWIKNGGKDDGDNPFNDDASKSNAIVRVCLSLDEYGEGAVEIERTDKPFDGKFVGGPVEISPLKKAKILKNKDGVIRIYQDFSDADDIPLWATLPHEKESDKAVRIESNRLRMEPIDFTFPNKKKSKVAWLNHRAFFKLPLSISFDIVSYGSESIRLRAEKIPLKEGDYGSLLFDLKLNDSECSYIGLHWIAGEHPENLFNVSSISLDSKFEKTFQMPGPSVKIENRFAISLSYGYGNTSPAPLEITNLTLSGKLVPLIGVSFNEKDSIIFIRNVMPNRPAAKSGFKEGDIIKTINGKTPKTAFEATEMIGNSSFDEEIAVVIERRGTEKTINVKPEL